MANNITGLHHVTLIAGDAQQNHDFYTGVLGMRLVKKSVNQDVTGTYHLFYADGEGHAGSDITFFPWPGTREGRRGIGLTNEIALAVPPDALGYWSRRLAEHGVSTAEPVTRFGERVLKFIDPHGVTLALAETGDQRDFTPWNESPVPAELQIRGLHSVRLSERHLAPTALFLTEGLGFSAAGEEHGWHRFVLADAGVGARSGRIVDVEEVPHGTRGVWGVGSVHHIAWRVPDDETHRAVAERVRAIGGNPTPVIDRFWFRSVYFKEPGGALFEVATDGPGFSVDESTDSLGERLVLPPWLESKREAIQRALPPLRTVQAGIR